jgi:hypothetical protein
LAWRLRWARSRHQLAALVMDGFAKRRPIVTNVGGREKIVLWIQITDMGRAALAD